MKKIIAILCALVLFTASMNAMAFSDVSGHWAENDINEMTSKGYLDGYPDGTFLPDNSVTRAEFLKILTIRYGITQNEHGYILWQDVNQDDWYSPYAAAGVLIPQYDDGNLYPSEFLQRYEAALALLVVYGIDYTDYTDSSASNMGDYGEYAGNSDIVSIISAALDNGIMTGKDDGFEPYEYLTRAELCTLLNRLKDRAADVTQLNIYLDGTVEMITSMTQPTENSGNTQLNDEQAYKNKVLELVNAERENNGLSPLKWDDKLAAAAQSHCDDMVARNFFAHENPDGKTPHERIKETGASFMMTGENIAAGQDSPETVMMSWMNSDGHRANILNPSYTSIGIGVTKGGGYGIYWTQCFGG